MRERIIVHVCCGICAIETFQHLQYDFEPAGYWYNPNIHPYQEYKLRLQTAGYVFQRIKKEIEWDTRYNIFDWFSAVMPHAKEKNNRCRICYHLRLEKTAQFAKQEGIKFFTTTMFASIHQDLKAIKESGISIGEKYGVEFLPLDLTKYYQKGKQTARQWHLYRQRYCGCLFSELEREGLFNENIEKR